MPNLHISIFCSGIPFNGDTLKKESLGGSETAALCMARELRKRGHHVYLFTETENPGEYDGVIYYHSSQFKKFIMTTPHDVCIVQRVPELFTVKTQAKLNILWAHDLALKRSHDVFKGVLWNIDQVAVLSDFMQQQYESVMGIRKDSGLFWKTRNGIDCHLLDNSVRSRDYKRLIYSARPERGLDLLLDKIFPRVLERDPTFKLALCSYKNPVAQMEPFYKTIGEKINSFGNNIEFLGYLTKQELYKEYRKSGLYVYPVPGLYGPKFREVFCISMLECMGSGLPVITSDNGALAETLDKNAGIFIEGDTSSDDYADKFTDAIFNTLSDEVNYQAMSKAGKQNIKQHDWSEIAKEWEDNFINKIYKLNINETRLFNHFKKYGDHVAANMVKPEYTYSLNDRVVEVLPEQLSLVKSTLDKLKGIEKIFDPTAACADLYQNYPEIKFEDTKRKNYYDALILINILEYQENPHEYLKYIERFAKPGAAIMCISPFGIHHYQKDRLWNLESSDYEDMLEHREYYDHYFIFTYADDLLGNACGFMFTKYKKDNQEAREINLYRKRNLQRPCQTVSVNIIASKGAENTMRWCLESVQDLADEIIIANCDPGMTGEGLQIANDYGAEIINAPNPTEKGFETPRNIILKHSTMDWIFWIDTDERLLDPVVVAKYLRDNYWNGYGVQQHHLSVDESFKYDMPVRLFRNQPFNNKTMKFYGMIHEHPELEVNKGPGDVIIIGDVKLAHIGYLTESVRKKRFWRNTPMMEADKEKYPDRLLQKHFIMRDNIIMCNYALAINGNVVTEEIEKRCQEVIQIFKEYFKGKEGYVNVDSLPYYSRANEILGQGIDVVFHVDAARGDKHLEGEIVRFTDHDDVLEEMMWRTEAALKPYSSPDW